jgi:hypothetical protein
MGSISNAAILRGIGIVAPGLSPCFVAVFRRHAGMTEKLVGAHSGSCGQYRALEGEKAKLCKMQSFPCGFAKCKVF